MKKFINPKVSDYHHNAIKDFSSNGRFVAGGVTKGYSTKGYSWIADFLYKNEGNLSINPHICYLDFVSDRDIMYQEYGNVPKIYDNYPFFREIERSILSDHYRELSTNQYLKIGQRSSEYADVRFINPSETLISFIEEDVLDSGIDSDGRTFLSSTTYSMTHEFYRTPVFHIQGYKFNLATAPGDLEYDNFNIYFFANDPYTSDSISEYGFSLEIDAIAEDNVFDTQELYTSLISGGLVGERMISYKLFVDNPVYSYFEEEAREWVIYYNDTVHYQESKFVPYYGLLKVYQDSTSNSYYWNSIEPMDYAEYNPDIMEYVYYDEYVSSSSEVLFFPEIIYNGKLEPAKIIINWGETTTGDRLIKGRGIFNPCNHLNEPDDQSRLVYNVSGNLINWDYGLDRYINRKWDSAGYCLYGGIDVDTERNRRYSAVVMTEPYFTVRPMGGGVIVEYEFVNYASEKISTWNGSEHIFMKIRGPLSIFTEIDEELLRGEENTDIINVVTIEDIDNNTSLLVTDTEYYNDFRGSSFTEFLGRQDDCLDDLVHNTAYEISVVGRGHHKEFYMDACGSDADKYSGNGMKICGAGYECKTIVDSNNNITGSKSYLNLYCSNYIPVNCKDPDEVEISNDEVSFLPSTLQSIIDSDDASVKGPELFKPMVKLQTMNGYVKIMERNSAFKTTRSSNGMYEMVYNVEFPYCPGSYSKRVSITSDHDADSDNRTISGFIYKKAGYINAGSHAIDSLDRFDIGNDRYVPYGDDSFTINKILIQHNNVNNIETDPFSRGGGKHEILSPERKRISYPPDIVWSDRPEQALVQLIKPNYVDFRRFGTYEIRLSNELDNRIFPRDMKFICYADNRQWKFDDDKFSSYIGRENPSFVCEINIETLSKNFTDYQKDHGAIPDVKRWLHGYLSGFGSMILSEENISGNEYATTMGNNNDMETKDSDSDFIIELWDSKYREEIINDETVYYGNWRSFMSTGYDYSKIPGSLIVSDVYISNPNGDDPIDVPDLVLTDNGISIYSINLGSLIIEDSVSTFTFPKEVKEPDDIINGKSNLVLYDKVNKRSYHIAYIKSISDYLYKAYIEWDPVNDPPLTMVQVSDIDEDTTADYELRNPLKVMNKSVSSSNTVIATDGVDDGFLTKNIDIKSITPIEGSYTDYERFVVDDKLYFRVRIVKKKDYPQSIIDRDESAMLYNGSDQFGSESLISTWNNFPWYDQTDAVSPFDDGFNWAKINLKESIRRIGLNHFKCTSK